MASTEDTEITLGTGKLLVLFFGLVAICALFFALGYSLGRKSDPGIATASAAVSAPATASPTKASGSGAAAAPMTFYKSVEQKDPAPQLTPAPDTKADTAAAATPAAQQGPVQSAVDPSTTTPTSGYFVQVAAVSKQEDADALVDALKKKDYPAFVASQGSVDKLFRVQLGPFSDIKEAEATRAKLVGDGYSPIVKK
jgi:cell division septation protein DedD